MKKIAILVIFVCVGSALSAQINFSAGAGLLLDLNLTSDTTKYTDFKTKWGSYNSNFGFYGFFDAAFAEADIGLIIDRAANGDDARTAAYLELGLLAKYPINLGGLIVFPLVGFQLDIPLSIIYKPYGSGASKKYKFEGTNNGRFDHSQFWIRLGGGADINITNKIFVRPSLLWGFRFNNNNERKRAYSGIDDINKDGKDHHGSGYKYSVFHHGFELRAAAGYRF